MHRHGTGLARILLAAWGATALPAIASWQDDIGYSALASQLGAALPNGMGVAVTLVEATDNAGYRPSDTVSPSSGNFAGKVFDFKSGPPDEVSPHAARAASFFFGLNTNPALGDASVAPLAGTGPSARVSSFEANNWLGSGFLRWNASTPDSALLPRSESSAVANHSWISLIDSDLTAGQANELLRRCDFSVRASDYVVAAGLNNGAGNPVPPILGSAYNVLSVGLTNGGHSSGTTPPEVDGAGRTKPELVAPMTATSWATAVVSSCAALLHEAAGSLTPAGVATDAQRSVVMRALLMAGARKDPFLVPGGPSWTQTTTRPLDTHYGAGEVNVQRSHRILTGGRFAPANSQFAGPNGWHFEPGIPSGGERRYFLSVPAGYALKEISAVLVWNRRIVLESAGVWSSPTPELVNLDLHLAAATGFVPGAELALSSSGASGSVAHPLEHIHHRDLTAGEYVLRITSAGPSTTDYGLAWLSVIEPVQPPGLSVALGTDGSTVLITLTGLTSGVTYFVENSIDLNAWAVAHTVVATGPTATWTTTASSNRGFYRLTEAP